MGKLFAYLFNLSFFLFSTCTIILKVNNLTKILFMFVLVLASVMVTMKGFDKNW